MIVLLLAIYWGIDSQSNNSICNGKLVWFHLIYDMLYTAFSSQTMVRTLRQHAGNTSIKMVVYARTEIWN